MINKINLILFLFVLKSILLAESISFIEVFPSGDLLINKSFKTQEGKTLRFESPAGDIRVFTSDKQEVRIKIYGDKDALDRIDLIYSETKDGIKLKVKKIQSFWNLFSKRFYVDYDIIIPKNFNLSIVSGSGDVFVKELNGYVKIKASSGDVNVENVEGEIEISTNGGDINLKKIIGNVKSTTTGGDIKLNSISGNVECQTTGGDLKIVSRDGSVNARTTGGDIFIDYSGENKGIKASTIGGNINLTIDENFEGYFSLSTIGGDIINDFQMTNTYERRQNKLEGEIKKREPRVELKTTGGDIKIIKRK